MTEGTNQGTPKGGVRMKGWDTKDVVIFAIAALAFIVGLISTYWLFIHPIQGKLSE
jgi:hypothetical protein